MACSCMACADHVHEAHSAQGQENASRVKQEIIRFSCAALFFVAGIILTAAAAPVRIYIGKSGLPITAASLLFIAAWLCAGLEVIQTVVKTAGKGSVFDENFLMTIATIGAFVLGEWTEGAAVMLFYNLGELLQGAAVRKSRRSISTLMNVRPECARLYRDASALTAAQQAGAENGVHTHEHEQNHSDCCGHIHTKTSCCEHGHSHGHTHETCSYGHDPGSEDEALVAPESVLPGTLIVVKAGEKVPLDGILVQGVCSFDTTSMTGESIPRFIDVGGTVLAGFVNTDGLAIIKTTAKAENTAAAKMLALVEQAQSRKAKTERLISRFARIYTPIVTISAVLLAVLPPFVLSCIYGSSVEWNAFVPWISRGLVFLVISCPCAFVISVPLGYFGGLGGAAKKGILIKGADFIDALAKTDTVVFDKTGTLTAGILTVQKIIPADGTAEDTLLELAYIAEYHSNHPIAQAVKHYIRQQKGKEKISLLEQEIRSIQQYSEKAGFGVQMDWHEKVLTAGSALFVLHETEKQPAVIAEAEGIKVFISYGGRYAGCIICSDSIKPQSMQAVKDLRNNGVGYLEMLTGDTKNTGEKIADMLQLDHCSSELLPHEKVARFEAISSERKTADPQSVCAFVGDGINDAPALARADIGIAMGAIGSDAAIEAADVVLMNDNPLLIAQAIRSARFTRRIVKENIVLSFAVKIAFLAGGAAGLIGLWAAVFADVGVALLAVCNSLRARRY